MGARGPAAEPKKLKQLKGNPGRRNLDKASSLQESEKKTAKAMPQKPAFRDKAASDIWDVTVLQLANQGTLSTIDASMIEIFCNNFARMRKLQDFIFEHGETYETKTMSGPMWKARPEVNMLMKCQQQHFTMANHFGLSPAARTRIPDPNQGDLFSEKNPWDSLN